MLSDQDTREIRKRLEALANPVKLVHFTQELGLEFGRETKTLLADVAALSNKLSLEVHNYLLDADSVAAYQVDKVPASVVRNSKDYGIRFYGLPSGFEFMTLLDVILAVSRGEAGVSAATQEQLRTLAQPVRLEVFVTPTCPHCPRAVRLAHRLAMASDLITADSVEATEFPELMARYSISAVPMTVVNGKPLVRGALPEEAFVEQLLRSVNSEVAAVPS